MYDHALFLQTLTGFTQSLVVPHNTQDVLEQLTESVSAVLGITGSGVSLAVGDRLTLATAVPPRVAELEQFQERSQQGPGVEAYRSGKVVTVTDLSQGEQEWGDYTKVASRLGLAAVAAAPLVVSAVHLGALTLYAAEPRVWPSDDVAVVVALGTLATAWSWSASSSRRSTRAWWSNRPRAWSPRRRGSPSARPSRRSGATPATTTRVCGPSPRTSCTEDCAPEERPVGQPRGGASGRRTPHPRVRTRAGAARTPRTAAAGPRTRCATRPCGHAAARRSSAGGPAAARRRG